MSNKVWSIMLQKHTKMIQHHVHIRSTDLLKKSTHFCVSVMYNRNSVGQKDKEWYLINQSPW